MALTIVSFDQIKDLLGLEGDDVEEYPGLQSIINRVTEAFQTYMGRDLEYAEEVTEIISMQARTSMLKLPKIPVISVASIDIKSFDWDDSYNPEDWMITSYGVEVIWTPPAPSTVTVVYTGGLKNNEIPRAISENANLQISYEYQNKDFIGSESVSTEGGTRTTPAIKLLDEVKRNLNRFRHPLRLSH